MTAIEAYNALALVYHEQQVIAAAASNAVPPPRLEDSFNRVQGGAEAQERLYAERLEAYRDARKRYEERLRAQAEQFRKFQFEVFGNQQYSSPFAAQFIAQQIIPAQQQGFAIEFQSAALQYSAGDVNFAISAGQFTDILL